MFHPSNLHWLYNSSYFPLQGVPDSKITLVGFYQVKDNNKKSLIDGKEEYVFAGYTRHEYAAYAYSN